MGLDEMIDAVADGSADAAVAALTMTADREQRLDFSHPFYASGLAIAVPTDATGVFAKLLRPLLSAAFLKSFAALVLVLGLIGLSIWLLERRGNPEHFGGTRAAGLGSGFWWAAVTMTTVGYGDKVPKTGGGRALGTVWMFVSIITISGFTAAIASSLTAFHLSSDIQGPSDLVDRRVGTVAGSTAQSALTSIGVRSRGYQTLGEGLDELAGGDIDALVYDAPLLLYRAATTHRDRLLVLPRVFEEQSYAIGLPQGSPLREPVNQSLLAAISGSDWDTILNRYLVGGE
jgi:ABC-type amino acid transport substrate-binding protein